MRTALAVCAVLVAAGFGLLGLGKVTGSGQMQDRAAHTGFTVAGYRRIGVLELLGAAGVLLGLAVWPLGAAAGLGLVTLLVGAVIVHRRSGHPVAELAPAAVFAALTSAYLILLLSSAS
jgi:uncharacterized membrane protein YphA (DoxX/SURF4 family)